jgi:PKD repeat protein
MKPFLRLFLPLIFLLLFFSGLINNCYSQITPDDIPNLKLWLKADSVNTVHLSGTDVLQWDNSVNIDSVAQSTPTSYPTYNVSVPEINNMPVLQFNGSVFLTGSNSQNYSLNAGGSIFLVYKTSSDNGNIISREDDNNPYYGWQLGTGANNSPPTYGHFFTNGPSSFVLNNTTVPIATGNFCIFEIINSPTSGTDLFLNGIFLVNSGYLAIGSNNANLLLGKGVAVNGFNNFIGDVAEIIIYDTPLSPIERQDIENYLIYKYAPPVNLGTDLIVNGFCNTTLDAGNWFTEYLWSTGEITQTITVNTSDTLWVRAKNVFGIYSYDTIIVNYPVINLSDTLFCSGSSVALSTGLGSSFTYNWSDGANTEINTVFTADDYWVTITDAGLCSIISDTITVTEDAFPITASLGPDEPNLCKGNTIGLETPLPLPSGLTYIWSTFENTPEIAISSSGTYTVTATDLNGCSSTDDINVTIVGQAPVVHFNVITGCSGNATQFTNTSNPPGNVWQWDFGDGQTSNQQNPSNTYADGGNDTVHLTVTDGICSNFLDSVIHIPYSPIPSFTVSQACINNPYTFFDQSTSSEGNIISWDWDFGDGSMHSNDTNPQYTYTSAGNFNVTLVISTDSGCTATFVSPITIVSNAPLPTSFALLTPGDNFISTDAIIDFSWENSAGAVTYTLEYSTFPNFSGSTSIPDISTNSYQETMLLMDTYYWHVIAYNICGSSIVSNDTNIFTVFSPDSIPGLQLWLMGDSADTLNSLVTQWNDQSGNGNDVVQSNAAYQPLYIDSVLCIYNRPVLNFNGASSYLSNSSPSGLTLDSGGSIFIVSKSSDNVGNIISKIDDNSPYYGWTAGLGWWSGNNEGNFFVNGAGSYSVNAAGTSIANDTFNIYEIIHSPSGGTSVYKNAILRSNNTYKAIGTNSAPLLVAKGIAPNNNNYFSGDIAEIIIYNTALNNQDRQSVENYLFSKYSPPPVNLGPDIMVNNLCPVTLDASPYYLSYLWNTGEDTSAIAVDTVGTYWVSVTDVFGVTSSDTIIVNKPVVLAYTDTICLGADTTIHSGLNAPYTTLWEWGLDSTWGESYLINAGDSIMLHVFDTSGCSVDRLITMVADSFPLSNLLGAAAISKCSGDTIFPLQDTGQYITYNWFDGSSNYSTPYFVVPVSWVSTGAHNLTLTCTNERGCSATDVISVTAPGQSPVMGFTATAGCEPFMNAFTDISTVAGAVINSWTWIFDDGDTISGLANPTHNFVVPGIHLVTLIDSTNKGCHMSITDTAFVYSKPDPAFSPLIGCTGVPVQFSDHSTSILGAPATWSWNFGDPGSTTDISTSQTPAYTYDSSGHYIIHYVVTTEYGCTDSIDRQIFIRPTPDVDFSYTDVCDGNPVYFTNETVDSLGIYQMYWDIDNGNIFTTYNPVYTFDGAGTYPVILVVQSINGCTVHDTQNVVVHALPVALFNPPDDVCLSYPDSFVESSTVLAPDSITEWLWDFGTAGTSAAQFPVMTFSAEGDYPVQLTVTSNAGCTSSATASIHVNPIPTAEFYPDEYYGMPPFTVNFDNISVDAQTSYWDFGDGTFFSGFEPQPPHVYTTQDTFMVMLVVTNGSLCTDTAWQEIYAIPTTADVAVTDVVAEQQGDFINVSATIWNYGTRKIYSLYLYSKASGGTMFMETWEDLNNPLLPATSMPYNFNAQLAIPEEQSIDYVCVEAQIQNTIPDDVPDNNEECVTFNNNFSAFIPYPAPSNDEINIDFILPFKDQVVIDLYGVKGELIKHIYSGEADKGLNKLKFDISDLNLGVYVYRITFNEDFRILRFVKY